MEHLQGFAVQVLGHQLITDGSCAILISWTYPNRSSDSLEIFEWLNNHGKTMEKPWKDHGNHSPEFASVHPPSFYLHSYADASSIK